MTSVPEQHTAWGELFVEVLKAAPTIWKVVVGIVGAVALLLSLIGVKVVSVPMAEVSRLAAQGVVTDTAIRSIRRDVDAVKWETTNLSIQVKNAMRPGLIDLCLTRTYDQVMRMGLNCDSLGVHKPVPR